MYTAIFGFTKTNKIHFSVSILQLNNYKIIIEVNKGMKLTFQFSIFINNSPTISIYNKYLVMLFYTKKVDRIKIHLI